MKKPSQIEKMKIVFNWLLPLGHYFLMAFCGKILIKKCDKNKWEYRVQTGRNVEDENHEMLHTKQAVSTKDSWIVFYSTYIWYYLKNLPIINGFEMPYKFNPFELEAYGFQHDLEYTKNYDAKAKPWKKYAKLTLKQKKQLYKEYDSHAGIPFATFIREKINPIVME